MWTLATCPLPFRLWTCCSLPHMHSCASSSSSSHRYSPRDHRLPLFACPSAARALISPFPPFRSSSGISTHPIRFSCALSSSCSLQPRSTYQRQRCPRASSGLSNIFSWYVAAPLTALSAYPYMRAVLQPHDRSPGSREHVLNLSLILSRLPLFPRSFPRDAPQTPPCEGSKYIQKPSRPEPSLALFPQKISSRISIAAELSRITSNVLLRFR